MKLQTKIQLEQQKHNLIDYHSKVLLLGSCFSENIGEKFEYFKFQNTINPFGILFHPCAIERLITHAINEKVYSPDDIFFENEQWHSFDAHSRLDHESKDQLLQNLNNAVKTTNSSIVDASHIIITLGTAWAYRHIESDTHVANCHKIPQKKFLKELLTVDAISESLDGIVSLIRSVNNTASILFTVSPVRHLKDGFIENNRSKSHLLAAVHNIVEPRKKLNYFPSFEIMMDELRDYRFYNEDMVHPNNTAIDYIWECFSNVWLAPHSQVIMKDVDYVQKGLKHKPFNTNSSAYHDFLLKMEKMKKSLNADFQHITF